MSVSESDLKFIKSVTVTDSSANGGRKGATEILTGVRHNLFPRVTKAERTAGLTRYRKQFLANVNADDDIAFGMLAFLEHPSNAGDRFYLGLGTQRNIQGDLGSYDPVWVGVGTLNTVLNGGETSIAVLMENGDFQWPNGGFVHIANKFMTGQTIDASVRIGDSVQYTLGTWYKIAPSADATYPKGIYVGGNIVFSLQVSTHEEWIALAENLYTDEVIGTGDGMTQSVALTTLTNKTKGVCGQPGKTPVVTATCGGITRTVYVDATGTCTGYCSGGRLNVGNGIWTTPITWSTAPDDDTEIKITYRENCFSYSGSVVTLALETGETVANAYATANTFVGGCVDGSDIETSFDNWSETSSLGTYDESGSPLTLFNDGTEEDTWTITFTSGIAFTCSGLYNGSVGSGVLGSNFSPVNPVTGQPFFTLLAAGWGGSWQAGDRITFQTHPSALPLWLKQVVPALTVAEANNCVLIGTYSE
jgi:hypothetical protein